MDKVRFGYNKIVRDKIPIRMERNGEDVVSLRLTGKDLVDKLIDKVLEEAQELSNESENPVDGIVDIQEVLDSLRMAIGISDETFEAARAAKRNQCGSFSEGVFVESVAMPEDAEWFAYIDQHPDRYPRITG